MNAERRLRPRFDRLEARLALSTVSAVSPATAANPGTLSVVAVDPAGGSILAKAPASIDVGFGRPINPSFVFNDIRIDRLNPDGTATPIDEAGNSITEAPDATGDGIAVATSRPLGPGHYRVVLLAGASVVGLDGSAPDLASDATISDFIVRPKGVGLADATDLGSPAGGLTVSGSLDLADDPGAVRLYRAELPPGQSWRLGVEVDAARIGSPLDTALAVFDADGHPIGTDEVGLPAFPSDPYLFVGLQPGVYYIGVSGAGNLPGQSGGYDPASATSGTARAGLASGAFQLRLVADPVAKTTNLSGLTLDDADPTDGIPTGLTLRFDAPIDVRAMQGHFGDLIELVDASGRTFSAVAAGYDAPTASVSFLFDQQLAPGRYTVKLGGQGGLVDLSGRAPTARGLPIGTLGAIAVDAAPATVAPNDVGTLFPREAQQGIGRSLTLGPGEQESYRVVIIEPGYYNLDTNFLGDKPTFVASEFGRTATLSPGVDSVAQPHLVFLKAGAVFFTATGGPRGTEVEWSLTLNEVQFDELLDNGVGPSDALSLRIIDPNTSLPGLGPNNPSAAPAVGGSPAPAPASPAATPAAPSGPSVLFLAAAPGPVGHPTSEGESVSVVGPATPVGTLSLATSDPGIPQGIVAGPGQRARADKSLRSGAIEALRTPTEVATESPTAVELPAPGGPVVLATVTPEAPDQPGAVERIASAMVALFSGARPAVADAATLDDAALAELDGDRTDVAGEERRVATADLAGSLGIGVIAVAVAHVHRRLGDWLGRRKIRLVIGNRHGVNPGSRRRPT